MINRILSNVKSGIFTIVVLIVIGYLTLFPSPFGSQSVPLFNGADKILHGLLFFTLICAVWFDYTKKIYPHHKSVEKMVALVVGCIIFGGLIEVLQVKMELGRTGDWGDFIADTVGVLLGTLISKIFLNSYFRRIFHQKKFSKR